MTGGLANEVRYTGGTIDSPIDPDWGELGNYGADSGVGRYLVNHDGTCDYGGISDPAGSDAYKVFGKENIKRQYRGKAIRTFKQFRAKMQGRKSKICCQKMKANLGENGRAKTKFGRETGPLSESRRS